jgi:hypothetical protein
MAYNLKDDDDDDDDDLTSLTFQTKEIPWQSVPSDQIMYLYYRLALLPLQLDEAPNTTMACFPF